MEEMVLTEEVNGDALDDWFALKTLAFNPQAFSERANIQTSMKRVIGHKYDTTSHAVRFADTHPSSYTSFATCSSLLSRPASPHV